MTPAAAQLIGLGLQVGLELLREMNRAEEYTPPAELLVAGQRIKASLPVWDQLIGEG
jgi:hypothetical protein